MLTRRSDSRTRTATDVLRRGAMGLGLGCTMFTFIGVGSVRLVANRLGRWIASTGRSSVVMSCLVLLVVGLAGEAKATVVLDENFNSYAPGDDPVDWVDTGPDNSLYEQDNFAVMYAEPDTVFGTTSSAANIHSHYFGPGYRQWSSYEFTGRMRMSDAHSGIGVTFYSDYPSSDTYYRLRRASFAGGTAFHLTRHPDGASTFVGTTDSGVVPLAGVWYRFRIEVGGTATVTTIRAKVWQDGDAEPGAWQIDCAEAGASRLTDGTVGLWSYYSGEKMWDDLRVDLRFDCNSNGIDDQQDLAGGTSTDCNGNGVPDSCDLAAGTASDCNGSGVPDDCELQNDDCNGNAVPDECDVVGGSAPDCNENAIPDDCDLRTGASIDCQSNGVPDECDIAADTSQDCDANGSPDECDITTGAATDCNENGTPDACELADQDCNGDAIPDECDIAIGTAIDCNQNGRPDSCDVVGGTSSDCQADGEPDECQVIDRPLWDRFMHSEITSFNWVHVGGATVDEAGLDEPSPPYSLRLDAGDVIVSRTIDLSHAAAPRLVYSWQRTGSGDSPETSDNLEIHYRTSTGSWLELAHHSGDGADMTTYQSRTIVLPPLARNANFAVRFHNRANGPGDDWFVDDIAVVIGTRDCNGNHVPDECDIPPLCLDSCSLDLNTNGIPDECDIADGIGHDCNGNSLLDEVEIAEGSSPDCNANTVPDECDMATGYSTDCNSNGVPDTCDAVSGTSEDCNGDLVPDNCEFPDADCNTNGARDGCDIAVGTSADCNVNGVPDECEIAAGTSGDCQKDSIPDECQDATILINDTFPQRSPNPAYWIGDTSTRIDDLGVNEPSPPYALHLGSLSISTEQLVSQRFDLSGDDLGVVSYYWQHTGDSGSPTSGCTLHVMYRKATGTYAVLTNHDNVGPPMSTFEKVTIELPPDAFNSNFALRFQSQQPEGCAGEWFIDSVFVKVGPSDCNDNGSPDFCDILPDCVGANCDSDCDANGTPDACDIAEGQAADCNSNNLPDSCDLVAGTSADCNNNEAPDECDLATGVEADCNSNAIPDSCDIAAGTSEDCDGNGLPDECEPGGRDCNANGVRDTCDLLAGTSADCNTNGVPDECDVAGGTSADCNGNVRPDECELAGHDCNLNGVLDLCDMTAGTSADCNTSSVPDECELAGSDCNENGVPDACELAATHDCCSTAHGSGCSDPEIEACVCAIDPYCCEFNWDRVCIGYVERGECGRCTNDCNTNGILDDCDVEGPRLAVLPLEVPAGIHEIGTSVAITGSMVFVGAPGWYYSYDHPGSVLLYRYDGLRWKELAIVQAPQPQMFDGFGWSVAVAGNRVIVGAPGVDTCTNGSTCDYGAAFIYRFDIDGDLHLEGELRPAQSSGRQFASSVAIAGHIAAISAEYPNSPSPRPESILVYRQVASRWVEEAELHAPDPSTAYGFEGGVAISGDVIAVGWPGHSGVGRVTVHRFGPSGWSQEAVLAASDGQIWDGFGHRVVFHDGKLLVSADYAATGGNQRGGAIYAFEFDGQQWSETQKIISPSPHHNGDFGTQFAVEQGLLIAAGRREGAPIGQYVYHVFDQADGQWNYKGTFTPGPESVGSGFGTDIALDRNLLIIGAPYFDWGTGVWGAAFVYGLNRDCNANGILDGCEIEAGQVGDCNGNYTPDACEMAYDWSPDCNANGVPDDCDIMDPGDFNVDGRVDILDLPGLVDCLTGPEAATLPAAPGCAQTCTMAFDMDYDLDVDLVDFAIFQEMWVSEPEHR